MEHVISEPRLRDGSAQLVGSKPSITSDIQGTRKYGLLQTATSTTSTRGCYLAAQVSKMLTDNVELLYTVQSVLLHSVNNIHYVV